MKRILLAAVLVIPSLANAEVLNGVFQTEPGDTGKFVHVQMGPCAGDDSLTCGTIIRAYNPDGSADNENENIGKPIVWDMVDDGSGSWAGGKIWAPDRDKTYNSKMALNGNILKVKGCVVFICRGQNWQRFE